MQKPSARVTFEQGVLESQESSLVGAGFLTDCLNWVPEPTGGLRVRGKWSLASDTDLPSTRRCVGIGMFSRYTTPAIVQMTPVVQTTVTTAAPVSPVFAWPVPTAAGNTLVAFVAVTRFAGAGSIAVTATNWTARAAISGATRNQAGVYELVTTASFTGDITPFTFTATTNTTAITAWIVELSGVTTLDTSAVATALNTSVVPATGATTQASELVLAFDACRQTSSTTPFTLSTATADWTKHTEAGQVASADYQDAAIYVGTRTATGAQMLTIASSTSVEHAAVLLTYKGWYATSPVPESVHSWLAANDDGTNIDIWSIPRDELATGTWTLLDPNVAPSGSPVAFTQGLGATWYTGTTFSGIRRYDGTSPMTVTRSPVGARCIAISNTRLWAGGTPGTPSRVQFSQVGDGSTWSGTGTGYFDFGKDDGETVEEITPFLSGLVVGKATNAWFLTGKSTDTFSPDNKLNAGGAAPGRSILATPYGCVLAGLEQVWFFDGNSVIPAGRGVEQTYGVSDYVSLSYQDGSIYIADGTLIHVFAINAGTWRFEKVGTASGDAAAIMYNYGDTQLYGPVASTTSSIVGFRTFPDPVRGRDEGLPETFRATTGDRWLSGPRDPITPRYLWLQVRQRGDAGADLNVDATYDSDATIADETQHISARTEGVYRDMLTFSEIARRRGSVKLAFTHDAADDEDVTYDLEAAAIEWEAGNA